MFSNKYISSMFVIIFYCKLSLNILNIKMKNGLNVMMRMMFVLIFTLLLLILTRHTLF